MDENISCEPVTFAGADGTTTIHGLIWRSPAYERPKGIVQLVHGMAEYIERYDGFASFLASKGFIVVGHDHLGHGNSIVLKDDRGHLPVQDGARVLVEDVHHLRSLIQERFGELLPYFMFGHSMGSFVIRSYITRYPENLAGAIICGTGHIPPAKSKAGRTLARLLARLRGPRHKSKLLDSMSVGAYSKAIEDARTPLDWLSHNTGNVDAYIADEKCGFMFTVGGNATLTDLTAEVCDPMSAAKIPQGLPLLYIAGAEDPVGDMGEGVNIAADLARKAGVVDVEVRIYENMRHEILNETGSERVYEDVLAWLEGHMA